MPRRRSAKRRTEKLVLGDMVRLDTLRTPARAEFVTSGTGRRGVVLGVRLEHVLVELESMVRGAARERRRLHGRIFVRPILRRKEN